MMRPLNCSLCANSFFVRGIEKSGKPFTWDKPLTYVANLKLPHPLISVTSPSEEIQRM
jgi:hypothetical protein